MSHIAVPTAIAAFRNTKVPSRTAPPPPRSEPTGDAFTWYEPPPAPARGPDTATPQLLPRAVRLLFAAADAGDAAACGRIVASGAAPVDVCSAAGWTPLHHAACFDRAAAVVALCAVGANVEARTPDRCTPLHLAATNDAAAAVAALVAAGADPHATSNAGGTPLTYAAWYGSTAAVEALCAIGRSRRDTSATPAAAPMALAQRSQRSPLVEGAVAVDRDARDSAGDTPLHHACRNGHAAAAMLLVERGARPQVRNNAGLLPTDVIAVAGAEGSVPKGAARSGVRSSAAPPPTNGRLLGADEAAQLAAFLGAAGKVEDLRASVRVRPATATAPSQRFRASLAPVGETGASAALWPSLTPATLERPSAAPFVVTTLPVLDTQRVETLAELLALFRRGAVDRDEFERHKRRLLAPQ